MKNQGTEIGPSFFGTVNNSERKGHPLIMWVKSNTQLAFFLFSFFFNIQEFTYENPSLPPDMDVRGFTTYKYYLTITIILLFFFSP